MTYIEAEELEVHDLLETIAQDNFLAVRVGDVETLTSAHHQVSEKPRQVLIVEVTCHLCLRRAILLILGGPLQVDETGATERKRDDTKEELGFQVWNHHVQLCFDLGLEVHMLDDRFEARDIIVLRLQLYPSTFLGVRY